MGEKGQFLDLALSDEEHRVRFGPGLDEFPHHFRTGGFRQLGQFFYRILGTPAGGCIPPGQGNQHGPFRTFRQIVAPGPFGQDLLYSMDNIAKGHGGHVLCLEGTEFLEHGLLISIQVRNHPKTQERFALGRFPGHGSHGVETQVPQSGQIHPTESRRARGMGVDAGNPAEPVLAPPGIRAGQFHMAVAAYGDCRHLALPVDIQRNLPVDGLGQVPQKEGQLHTDQLALIRSQLIDRFQLGEDLFLQALRPSVDRLSHKRTPL